VRYLADGDSCTTFPADPVIYIADEIIYAPENRQAEINASVYSSNTHRLAWYHEGRLINVTSDTRYTVNSSQGFYLYTTTLTITRLEATLLGRYDVTLTAGNVNHSDTVQLEFASE
jgi:hypothetical protein